MTTDPFISLLLEAIQAREEKARACEGREWEARYGPSADDDEPEHWVAGLRMGDTVAICGEDYTMAKHHAPFIADNDPSSVLRRCKADRDMLAQHKPLELTKETICQECSPGGYMVAFPCVTVRILAEGFGLSTKEETT